MPVGSAQGRRGRESSSAERWPQGSAAQPLGAAARHAAKGGAGRSLETLSGPFTPQSEHGILCVCSAWVFALLDDSLPIVVDSVEYSSRLKALSRRGLVIPLRKMRDKPFKRLLYYAATPSQAGRFNPVKRSRLLRLPAPADPKRVERPSLGSGWCNTLTAAACLLGAE